MHILTNSLTKLTILATILLVVLSVNYLRAFNGPPGTAPDCPTGSPGCDAPLNTGTGLQEKTGDLKVQSLWATTSILSDGYYFSVSPLQGLYGDLGVNGQLVWDSGHATKTQMVFRDASGALHGKIFGDSNGLYFGFRDSSNKWMLLSVNDKVTPANSEMRLRVNDDTKMTIQSDGKVGIGDPTPEVKLDVEGNVGAMKYCDENGNNCFDPVQYNNRKAIYQCPYFGDHVCNNTCAGQLSTDKTCVERYRPDGTCKTRNTQNCTFVGYLVN